MIVAQDIMFAAFRDDGAERRGHKVTVLRLTADRATRTHRPHAFLPARLQDNKTARLNDVGSDIADTLGKKIFSWDELLVDFAFDVKTNGVIAGRFAFDKLVSDADANNVVFRVGESGCSGERAGAPGRKISHRAPFRLNQFIWNQSAR